MTGVEDIQPDIEQRVLAELICNPDALAFADTLEAQDFHVPIHRAVMGAIREIQLRGEPINALAVVDELEVMAAARGGNVQSADLTLGVGRCLLQPKYCDWRECLAADMRFLRRIAKSRNEAWRSAS